MDSDRISYGNPPQENVDQDALEARSSNRCFNFDDLWGVFPARSP